MYRFFNKVIKNKWLQIDVKIAKNHLFTVVDKILFMHNRIFVVFFLFLCVLITNATVSNTFCWFYFLFFILFGIFCWHKTNESIMFDNKYNICKKEKKKNNNNICRWPTNRLNSLCHFFWSKSKNMSREWNVQKAKYCSFALRFPFFSCIW